MISQLRIHAFPWLNQLDTLFNMNQWNRSIYQIIKYYKSDYYNIFFMKSQRIVLPSFLGDLDQQQLEKAVYKFKKKSVKSLMDMVKQELGNTLNPKFISVHRKQLQIPHFCLQVSNQYKSWTIIKRLTHIVQLQKILKKKYSQKVPSVPIRKQSQISSKNQNELLQFFQLFMNMLAKNKDIKLQKQFVKFIQNFVPPQRKKMKIFKQLQLSKRAGGRHTESTLKRALTYFISWTNKYFTITSQGVYFTASDQDFRIEEMIPFSVGFKLLYGEADTGYTYGIVLNSAHRLLNINAENIFNLTYFVYFIRKAMKQNNYLSIKRYHSFSDVRSKCHANYYVDGKHYFSDVCDALLSAKSEVCITGWMISPYFSLKRPDVDHKYRLDNVLAKIAKIGIKINIIVYMEPKVALNIDSQFTELYLTSLSPNIKVLRHPAYLLIPFLWSHHQKMVIIDQKVAFVGGLDIGYGRYDDNEHKLTDLNQQFWPGIDYCNYRKTDILKPKQFSICSINRTKQPRMPWHDVAVRISGQSVIDLSRHFVQFWNYVNFQLNMDQRQLLMYAGLHEEDIDQLKSSKSELGMSRQLSKQRKSRQKTRKNSKNHSQSIRVDHEQKQKETSPLPSVIDQEELMIDHEKQLQFYANHIKSQTSSQKIGKIINKIKDNRLFLSASRHGHNFQELVVTQIKQDVNLEHGNQKHQFLRSASMWSLGLGQGQEQRSILEAYVQLIFNSKEFIYIENQFFISIQNTISKALVQRISRAYQKKQRFKVVVVLPSLPGFDGQIYNEISAVMRIQVHYIYQTICRGQKSILEQLKFIKNISDYIQFFTLRTHGLMDKTPVTELIYVHSKLMIIDDEKVLIGSANINDRSLLGTRDSEIAIVIEDEQTLYVKIHGSEETRKVKKFAHNLRTELFMEHFGVKRQQTQDYLNEDTWWSMIVHADKNQQIYRQVFGIYPDNSMRTFKDIFKVHESSDPTKYQLLKQLIKGNAILFQYTFLDQQSLILKPSQKQYYVPAINFT